MAEYIERDAAMDIFGDVPMWQGYYEPYPWEVHCAIVGIVKLLKEEISKIPAADVAPVVRCKDCVSTRKKDDYESVYLDYEVLICTNCEYGWQAVWPNHFCGYGKRKDEAQNER